MPHVLAQDLRNAVLQAAIHGRLSEHIEGDSSIYDALSSIKLDNDKSLGKSKKYHTEPESDYTMDLPEHWAVVHLYEICNVSRGRSQHRPRGDQRLYKDGTIPLIQTGEVANSGKYITTCNSFYNEEGLKQSRLWKKGTLCMSIAANIGDVSIMTFDACFPDSVIGISALSKDISEEYLFYLFKAMKPDLESNATKMAQKNLSVERLNSILFPIPPIEEQARIVARVDELMAKIDEYEKLEKELVDLQSKFPGDMKDAILQAAMQGKLTEKSDGDQSVDILLKHIEDEKQELIKTKKMKKEKPLSPFGEEEIAINIPEHWRYVRTGDVIDCGSGSTPLKGHPEFYDNGTIPWLKTGELNNSYIINCEEKITELAYKKGSFRMNHPGDILIAMYGATIGKLGVCTFPLTTNQACLGCTPLGGINNRFFYYFLMSAKAFLIDKAEGGAQPNISRIKVRNLPFPLPPIEEQQRIVEKLDKLLPLCESLEKLV